MDGTILLVYTYKNPDLRSPCPNHQDYQATCHVMDPEHAYAGGEGRQ